MAGENVPGTDEQWYESHTDSQIREAQDRGDLDDYRRRASRFPVAVKVSR